VLTLATGCSVGASSTYPSSSAPSASPDTSWDQRYCELQGGYWNRNANVCESPLYRW
jgi:hypothetical protein